MSPKYNVGHVHMVISWHITPLIPTYACTLTALQQRGKPGRPSQADYQLDYWSRYKCIRIVTDSATSEVVRRLQLLSLLLYLFTFIKLYF